ncbi:hypothetical protein BH23ACT5_BH23ACT5_14520 [soil metagenome]
MIVSLRSAEGSAWGALGLYREPGRPMFGDDEKAFLSTVAPYLAEGARRGLLLGEANDPDQPYGPGLVVLADDWTLESSTPGVQELLADLPGANGREDHLPAAVLSVAGQAKRGLASGSGEVAFARVRSMSGRWVLLHGVSLLSHRSRRVAVIIELAHPARISPLLMAAYKLSEREQEVTRQVLQGSATKDIAEALFISTHTVQQHLKSIFDKTGVRSRRDLVGRIFFSHYEPRLRDNEQRAVAGKPLRGGPAPPPPTPEVSGASR